MEKVFFRNAPSRNKKCLWWSCLLTDWDEMSILYRGLPLMLPTKFRYIWPSGFGEDLKKMANQKQEFPVAAMFVNRLEQNEQSLEKTFHRCFLSSLSSFG